MYIRIIAALSIMALTFLGCSGNGSGSEGSSSPNSLAVRAVNTGSGDLELSQEGEASTVFCYEEDGCETPGGFSFNTVSEGQESLVDYSHPDGKAVGVKVNIKVDAGSGYLEIVTGETYRDDSDFLEFDTEKVVHTTDEFSAETTITFDYGETD